MFSTSLLLRRCGDCRACCTPLAIEELRKPAGVPCPHIDPDGGERGCCKIYETRPPSCVNYLCGWRAGLGADRDRPDRSGVVLTGKDNTEQAREAVRGLPPFSYLAHEAHRGAFREPQARSIIERVASTGFVVFALYGDGNERCKLFGPEPVVRATMAYTKGDPAAILVPGSIIRHDTRKPRRLT